MIVGIVGRSIHTDGMCSLGTGKDTVADALVTGCSFIKVAQADPIKRFCMETYDFTYDQLWGPSELRAVLDKRYPRDHTWVTEPDPDNPDRARMVCPCCGQDAREEWRQCYLTPRFALQQLGTQWGRNCYDATWIARGMATARTLLDDRTSRYRPEEGLMFVESYGNDAPSPGVVFSDIRFKNELRLVREGGGIVVLITREHDTPLPKEASSHQSEHDLDDLLESDFDLSIKNDGTIMDLLKKADAIQHVKAKGELLNAVVGVDPAVPGTERTVHTVSEVGGGVVGVYLDSKLIPEDNPLHKLVKAREKDVEDGRIVATSAEDLGSDVPPFMRGKRQLK